MNEFHTGRFLFRWSRTRVAGLYSRNSFFATRVPRFLYLMHKSKNPDKPFGSSGLSFNPGNDLVSHKVALAVPSAQRGLTSVFGMGTGVALSIQSPETFYNAGLWIADVRTTRLKSVPHIHHPQSAIRHQRT